MRVLVVNGKARSTTLLEEVLREASCTVDTAERGEDALGMARHYDYDAMLLDLALPDITGGEVLRRLRAAGSAVPVIVLTGTGDRAQRIQALFDGADDCLARPLDHEELVARLKAVVRRARGHATSEIRIGRMTIDLASRTVSVDGQPLKVTGKEYSILELLALRRGATLSKEVFLDHLYGGRDEPEQKIIDVFMCKLRKKIQAVGGGAGIETIWGRGYVLREQPGLAEAGDAFFGPDLDEAALWRLRAAELEALMLGLLPDDGAGTRPAGTFAHDATP